MKSNDFSLDLETLGTRYNAAILSIGVVQFDINTGQLGAEFYREIEIHSALKAGEVTGSTLAWWARQGEAAKRVFGEKDKTPLAVALDEMRAWMLKHSTDPRPWGNGASFDITIVEHAYDNGAVGLKEPWRYTKVRDMRTIMDYADAATQPKRSGTHHNALDDAKHQALCIAAAHQSIVGKKTPETVLPITRNAAGKPGVQAAQDDEL